MTKLRKSLYGLFLLAVAAVVRQVAELTQGDAA